MESKEFPIDTQIGTFKNEHDLELWLNDQWIHNNKVVEFLPIDYCLIKHSPFIYTDNIQEILNRYSLFKNYGVISFSNNYDEMPAKWIDALTLIDIELSKAQKEKSRING